MCACGVRGILDELSRRLTRIHNTRTLKRYHITVDVLDVTLLVRLWWVWSVLLFDIVDDADVIVDVAVDVVVDVIDVVDVCCC